MRIIKLFAAGAIAIAVSCNNAPKHGDGHEGHAHESEETVHSEEAHAHSGEISLPAAKALAAGVVSEVIEPGSFMDVIVTGGDVESAPGDAVTIVANVSGVVDFRKDIAEGVRVSEDEILFSIVSDGLLEGDPVSRAKIEYETAKAEYDRAARLVDENIVSRKEFESIRSGYETARLKYEAISGGGASDGGAAVVSPKAGYVSSCLVKSGDYVTVGQPLAIVSGNDRLYLTADVSERYAARVSGIRDANFRLQYGEKVYSASGLGGRLVSYGRNTGEASPFIPVTFVLNRAEDIIPGSYAEIWLMGEERDNVISLPVSALTEEQGVYFVYVRLDEDCYRKQPVTVGATDGLRAEILSGLEGGEMVVVEGAIHVRLASASNAIPAHTHNH